MLPLRLPGALRAAAGCRAAAWLLAALIACLSLGAPPLLAEVAVPALTTRVTDLTATFKAGERDALEGELAAIETRTGAQFAVLLVPTTQGEPIEQFALRVAEAWKLGRKGSDNGLLLLVAKNDRKVRIEVGYGLEGDIPDAIARRVIAETIAPRFQAGDFAGGVTAGVQRLAGRLESGTPQKAAPVRRASGVSADLPLALLVGLLVIGSVLRRLLGRVFGGLTTAGIAGGLALEAAECLRCCCVTGHALK